MVFVQCRTCFVGIICVREQAGTCFFLVNLGVWRWRLVSEANFKCVGEDCEVVLRVFVVRLLVSNLVILFVLLRKWSL
jgi:hypothetical protein